MVKIQKAYIAVSLKPVASLNEQDG